ncbi:NUDIX hydrolase [Peribacillus sp. SCS-26]|uniref:NUDIX hydrolase n=1 Tax=Paraperibacillus marinus TaxID=3115295 RepID=UPI0039063590
MEKSFSRVVIKDKLGRYLVLHDRESSWNFPGGKQETGETPAECAIREVREETGLHIHKLSLLNEGNFRFGDTTWRGSFFFADAVSGTPEIMEKDKIASMMFIESLDGASFPEELHELIYQLALSPQLSGKMTSWE